VGPLAGLDVLEKKMIFCHSQESNYDSSIVHPQLNHYIDHANPLPHFRDKNMISLSPFLGSF